MENLFEQLTEMVESTINEEGKLNIILIHKTSSFSDIFVPYECDFKDCIYIEGDNAVLNLENIEGMEISLDIDEYRIAIEETTILISRI